MYLCISDFDKTLINDNNSISDYTKNTINKFVKNNNFIIVSESSFDELLEFKNKYDLDIDLMSSSTGILLINNKVIKNEIDSKKINTIITLFKDYIYTAYNDKIVYSFQERLINLYPKNYIENNKFESSSFINIAIDINKNDDFINFLNSNDLVYILIGKDKNRAFYNVKNADFNKTNAYNILKDYYKNKKTIGFSDSYSDFKLLSSLDIKVAMKNGDDLIKKSCDYITEYDNNNDGVAIFLNNICHL